MGSSKSKVKRGMNGSNGGRSRYEYTEVLKKHSKKRRRCQGKHEVDKQVLEMRAKEQQMKYINKELKWLEEESAEIEDKIEQLTRVKANLDLEIKKLESEKES